MLIFIITFIVISLAVFWPEDKSVVKEHKGLEMLAHNGRLTHVRETTSEKEL